MEIRDPIHVFIRLEDYEQKLLDSRPVQRLRHIHQLATTPWVYPGASHRRFEHSLGVMELATRIFDTVVDKGLPEGLKAPGGDTLRRWRCTLRAAALCHDIGHLPFSHAAEKELLPTGVDHEVLGLELLESEPIRSALASFPFNVSSLDVAKLAIGPKKMKDIVFTDWELLLSEIITADALGADRMDYLLRDSYHAGVAYGRFDHYRLIDTMKVLETVDEGVAYFKLGVEEGGLVAAEALLLARYQMYSQVYLHKTRRILDIHLKEFLQAYLPNGRFPEKAEDLLAIDDNIVLGELSKAAVDPGHSGHLPARRLLCREHYRALYHRSPEDEQLARGALWAIAEAAGEKFGKQAIRVDPPTPPKPDEKPAGQSVEFPVLTPGRQILWSSTCSQVARSVPPVEYGFVFVDPGLREEAIKWLRNERHAILERVAQQQEAA